MVCSVISDVLVWLTAIHQFNNPSSQQARLWTFLWVETSREVEKSLPISVGAYFHCFISPFTFQALAKVHLSTRSNSTALRDLLNMTTNDILIGQR